MSAFNVYLAYSTPTGYSDYENITEDVIEKNFDSLKQNLEADEYNIGKITFDNISITLRNEHSKYSDASNPVSIFPYKRDETLIKIEWGRNSYPLSCGNTACGETFLSDVRTVFKGLLEDNSTKFDVLEQVVKFKILSLDSIINKVGTPFSLLNVSQDADTLLYNILNQTRITQFFTVSPSNINTSYNFTPDSIASLENTSCFEAIQEILLMANSIMYVKNDVVYIRSRSADIDSSFVFYGPSSNAGIENILNIRSYQTGLNKCFNYWTWKDTTLKISFVDSIGKYGERKKELDSELITNDTKRLLVMNSYITEFGFPSKELTLVVPMFTQIVDLSFLNRIHIDYPSDILPIKDVAIARYGQAIYGESKYARSINSLFISVSQSWKILNIIIDTKKQEISFKLREVL